MSTLTRPRFTARTLIYVDATFLEGTPVHPATPEEIAAAPRDVVVWIDKAHTLARLGNDKALRPVALEDIR